MNNDRRKQIAELKTKLEALKELTEQVMSTASDLQSEASSIRDDEEEYHDNIPESMEEKRSAAYEKVENLTMVDDSLGEIEGSMLEASDKLTEIMSELDTAVE